MTTTAKYPYQAPLRLTEEQRADLDAIARNQERTMAQEIRYRLFKMLPQSRDFLERFVRVKPFHPDAHEELWCIHCSARPDSPHAVDCLWLEVVRWLDRTERDDVRRATFAAGVALGCPACKAGEPHVCPFLEADKMPEPRRSQVLEHMRRELADVE